MGIQFFAKIRFKNFFLSKNTNKSKKISMYKRDYTDKFNKGSWKRSKEMLLHNLRGELF